MRFEGLARQPILGLFLITILSACSNTDGNFVPSDATVGDGITVCTDPLADTDGDGILDGEEDCLTGRDSDGDGSADWQDFDSDDDGIPDAIEAGPKTADSKCASTKAPNNSWPCDTDGDGYPDYLDVDSDGDGIDDTDEDANGDGLLGCCLTDCKTPLGNQDKDCILMEVGDKVSIGVEVQPGEEGCGQGQLCKAGKCTPAIGFQCSNGETNPALIDTFGDGKLDNERGTFICRDATEDKPQGRKPVQTQKSESGDYHVAIEVDAVYGELKLTGAGPKEVAGLIEYGDPATEVAGFVVSRDTTKDNIQDELSDILQSLQANVPGGSGTVSIRASGAQGKSHDKYNTIKGTIVDVELQSPASISAVRNQVIATLLGKSMGQLGNLPGPFGASHTNVIIRFVTVKRFAFKKDAQDKLELDANGNPIDSGDKSQWRLLIMGAVAGRDNFQDVTRPTGFIVDDLSNGTSLATAGDSVDDECDVGEIEKLPVADVVWVVDESGSMDNNRQDIVNNANNFFSRALASGLDFRMGITGVVDPDSSSHKYAVGKFCSKISTNDSDDGGADRFLLSTEQAIFSSCINNPPGYEGGSEYGLINAEEAMKKHLPRAVNDQTKFRPSASAAFIIATDEIPNSLSSVIGFGDYDTCQLDATKQGQVDTAVKKYIDLFSGAVNPEATATFHVIGGVCNNSCSADVAHGYTEVAQAVGGQIGDVCQKDLGNTLQVIIDSIIGAASPVVLEYVPISSSLAVALDGKQLERSRTNGFDYRGANNSVVLINVPFDKGSEIIASYKRWSKQLAIK